MPGLPTRTFSESWYRIADNAISLRPSVAVHRQFFRGEKWYVLQDPYNNQFFRLRPAAYEFVVRLRRDRTVAEVWAECLDRFGEDAPGQEEVIQLLAQLYHANLLQHEAQPDSVSLFKRFSKQREAEIKSRLAGFMFPRITLLDPDRFLKATLPLVSPLMGKFGALVWLAVVGFGVKCVVDNLGAAIDQSQAVLAPGNLLWLYVGLLISKVLHEFGHAYVCRRAGGEVHRMGVMFLIFTPLPFVDATSSWALRERWQRIKVSAAGMLVEVFLAAIAAAVWAATGEGLLHRICYNIVFTVSVSTLLFNANPLLRFDGYYILSDLLDIPNLHERSRRQIQYLAQRWLLGYRHAQSLARSYGEAIQLFVFGVLSGIYRIVVFTSIMLFVADQLLIVGVLFALLCAVSWVIVPVVKFLRYLLGSPELTRTRVRAVSMAAGIPAAVLVVLGLVPVPHAFMAPGVLESDSLTPVYTQTAGYVYRVHVRPGDAVGADDVLLTLTNRALDLELAETVAKLDEVRAVHRQALQESQADLAPIESLLTAVEGREARLREEREGLTLAAAHGGDWDGRDLREFRDNWVAKGTEIGRIVGPAAYTFTAIVPQSEASRLFSGELREAGVRVRGQAQTEVAVQELDVIPIEQQELPSEALGWQAGGSIETDYTDPTGRRTREPFFRVRARVATDPAVVLAHGMDGIIRFNLPPEPLLPRWMRKLRQLLQKRYKL